MMLKTTVLIAVLHSLLGSVVEGAHMMMPPGDGGLGYGCEQPGFAGFGVPPAVNGFERGYNGYGQDYYGAVGVGGVGLGYQQQPLQQQGPTTVKKSVTECHKVEHTVPPTTDSKWGRRTAKSVDDDIDSDEDDDDEERVVRREEGRQWRKRSKRRTIVPVESAGSAGSADSGIASRQPQQQLANPLPIISPMAPIKPATGTGTTDNRTKRELQDCKDELRQLRGRLASKKAVKGQDDPDDVDEATAAETVNEKKTKKKAKKGSLGKRLFKGKKNKKKKKEEESDEAENPDADAEADADASESKESKGKKKKGLSKGAKAGLAIAGLTTAGTAAAIPAIIAALADKNKKDGGDSANPVNSLFSKLFNKDNDKKKEDGKANATDAGEASESVGPALGVDEASKQQDEPVVVNAAQNQAHLAAQMAALKPDPIVVAGATVVAAPVAAAATAAGSGIVSDLTVTPPTNVAEVTADPEEKPAANANAGPVKTEQPKPVEEPKPEAPKPEEPAPAPKEAAPKEEAKIKEMAPPISDAEAAKLAPNIIAVTPSEIGVDAAVPKEQPVVVTVVPGVGSAAGSAAVLDQAASPLQQQTVRTTLQPKRTIVPDLQQPVTVQNQPIVQPLQAVVQQPLQPVAQQLQQPAVPQQQEPPASPAPPRPSTPAPVQDKVVYEQQHKDLHFTPPPQFNTTAQPEPSAPPEPRKTAAELLVSPLTPIANQQNVQQIVQRDVIVNELGAVQGRSTMAADVKVEATNVKASFMG